MDDDGLGDPRETKPEMGENAYGMIDRPSRIELLADLLRETHRIENHASWLEQSNEQLHARIHSLEEKKDDLIERVVRAERALAGVEERDRPLSAALYLETLDEGYLARLRDENAEARSTS